MTPEEAVAGLTNRIMRQVWNERELTDVLAIFDAVAATAKANETRRSAARCEALRARCVGTVALNTAAACAKCRDDILRSGGLEVDE